MAKITFKGLEEYEHVIQTIYRDTPDMLGRVTYEGARVVADEIRKGIESLPIVKGYGTAAEPLPGGVTKAQKEGLLEGFGISGMQDDGGFVNVKLGFDGYNSTKTQKYPQGQPNQMVARGVESGTSWKQKLPFVRLAIIRARKRAAAEMAKTLDKLIADIIKTNQ